MKNDKDLIFEAYSKTFTEEANLDNTPLEELSILSPEEYEMVQNFENFDANDWGYNKLQRFYFRKREGGEEDESVGDSSNFEDKAEKFADVIGDIELEYLVNLSGGEFEILKGFLQDQMGYRDLGQYKRN